MCVCVCVCVCMCERERERERERDYHSVDLVSKLTDHWRSVQLHISEITPVNPINLHKMKTLFICNMPALLWNNSLFLFTKFDSDDTNIQSLDETVCISLKTNLKREHVTSKIYMNVFWEQNINHFFHHRVTTFSSLRFSTSSILLTFKCNK